MKRLLLIVALLGLGVAPATRAEAIACLNIPNVTSVTDCSLGGLTFSNFSVSASAGFDAAVVGLGNNSTAALDNVNLAFQFASTPNIGPGDILLSYGVTAGPEQLLTGIDIANNAIVGPVTIGELACRVPFSIGGACAPSDRLASLLVGPGETAQTLFAAPVQFAFLHKDIAIGAGGFISDFSNSHDIEPIPEPATLLLFGTALTGLGVVYRRRRNHQP